MKKILFRLSAVFTLLSGTALAQPFHQPLPNYTNDACNRTGHSYSTIPVGEAYGGFMENTMAGVEIQGNTHFIVQNVGVYDDRSIAIAKKDASTGAPLGEQRYNTGIQLSGTAHTCMAWSTWLNASQNRLYIVGQCDAGAFVMCVSTSTLLPVAGFGTNGVYIFETGAVGKGITGTGVSNNITLLADKNGTVVLKEFTSALVPVMNGTIAISGFTLATSYASLKRGPNGRYYFCGSSTNPSNVESPMIWDIERNTTANSYTVKNSTYPTGSEVGTGFWRDFDFYINPSPTNPMIYQCDIVAVGNSASAAGIYARYIINNSVNYYTADPSFTNQGSLPGKSLAVNNTATDIRFTKCRIDASGYPTILAFHNNTNSDRIIMGYLNPSGTTYTTTYLNPGNSSGCERVHKATGLLREPSGDFVVSGCTTIDGYVSIKLSNSDCTPIFNLHGSSQTICQGENGYINPNIITPNCNIRIERVTNSGNVLVYNGLPVSLIVQPTTTTTYIVTVTNNATGCTATQSFTMTVIPNDPSFTMTYNTFNTGYYNMWAAANDQTANTYPGFGYAWILEEIDIYNNTVFIFNNPSCWWYPLSQSNDFRGVDCILNNYIGTQTISNCSTPPVGRFKYGKRYRLTRGTWNADCGWRTTSVIILKTKVIKDKSMEVEEPTPTPEHIRGMFADIQNEGMLNAEFSVYPNPNNGTFTLICDGMTNSFYEVFDMTGKLILTIPAEDGLAQQVDLREFGKGVYFIHAEQNGTIAVQKLIVQ